MFFDFPSENATRNGFEKVGKSRVSIYESSALPLSYPGERDGEEVTFFPKNPQDFSGLRNLPQAGLDAGLLCRNCLPTRHFSWLVAPTPRLSRNNSIGIHHGFHGWHGLGARPSDIGRLIRSHRLVIRQLMTIRGCPPLS